MEQEPGRSRLGWHTLCASRSASAEPMEEVVPMMSDPEHRTHEDEHPHVHSAACGHETRKHGDHDDYEHDGHWHAKDGEHYDEHGDVAG